MLSFLVLALCLPTAVFGPTQQSYSSTKALPHRKTRATKCTSSGDVVFVLDASGSVGQADFTRALTFISQTIDDLDVDSGQFRIGLITFSSSPRIQFNLNKYNKLADVKSALQSVRYTSGGTNTAAALRNVRTSMLTSAKGDRYNVSNIVVVITDGASHNEQATVQEATSLKNAGVTIIAVAVKRSSQNSELVGMTSPPISKNLIFADNYGFHDKLKEQLIDPICTGPYSPGRSVVKPDHIYVNGEHTVILRCQFSTVQGYMYTISWSSDEKVVKVSQFLSSSEAQTHFITDDDFAENSDHFFSVNQKIHCIANVFEIKDAGDVGNFLERSTPEIFTPLEIDLTPISMSKGEDKIIPVKINIPFGCSPSSVNCSIQVQLYNPTEVFARNQLTVGFKNTGVCGVQIDQDEFLQNGKNLPINRNIVVTSVNDMQFERQKTVNLKVKTKAVGNTKSYWTRTSSDSVPISIAELQSRRWTSCYSHVDPHMRTFDGRRYENQNLDEFVMYLNKDWQIMIQSKTKRCNRNRATCSCSCTMKSGGDIFMINHCDTHRTQFLSDKNKALYVYRVRTNKYEIKFPNLLRVIVQITAGREYIMNIDIYPAPTDRNRVEGLCGNFNGDPDDDFVPWGSTYSTSTINFAMSWGLIHTGRHSESLQSSQVVKGTTRWNEGGMYCVCPNEKTGGDKEAVCKENKQDLFMDKNPGNYLPITAKSWVNPVEIQTPREVKKRDVSANTNDTLDLNVAKTLCESALQGCPIFLQQDEFSGINVESFLEECAMDVAMTGDVEWAIPHCDALSNKVVTQLEIDEEFKNGLNETVVYEVLSQTCPGNCSGHGTCLNGSCVCENGYGSDECLVNLNIPPVLDDISPDGFCDFARGEDCYDITISSDGFIDNPTCRIQIEQVDVTGYYGTAVTMNADCSYLEFNELSVNVIATDLRQKISDNGTVIAERYGFSVSNNDVNFSEFRYVSVIDSRCQNVTTDVNGAIYVQLEPGFCIIDRVCYPAENTFTACSRCDPSRFRFNWTNVCTDSGDSHAKLNIVVIAVSTATGIMALFALSCIVVWAMHSAKKADPQRINPSRNSEEFQISEQGNKLGFPRARPAWDPFF